MKRLCANLKEQATEIFNYKKKEMLALTKKDIKSYNKQKFCQICKVLQGP